MHILQYYTASPADKDKIIALAELLGCQYRAVENIIAVLVNDVETLGRLKRCECLPWAVQAGWVSSIYTPRLTVYYIPTVNKFSLAR